MDQDFQALEVLRQRPWVDACANNHFLEMKPQDIPEKHFYVTTFDLLTLNKLPETPDGCWKRLDRQLGWGIRSRGAGFSGLKRTFVFHTKNQYGKLTKTNWIMTVYWSIKSYVLQTDAFWCRVFQSNDYNPRPPCFIPNLSTETGVVDPLLLENLLKKLEAMADDPDAFMKDENYNPNGGGPSTGFVSGRNGKRRRSAVWDKFTEIKACGPNGEVVTLAICNHCCMVYRAGNDNGTKTLKEHSCKCGCNH